MAIHSVKEVAPLINRQIELQERIEACLWKLEALVSASLLANSFYELPETTIHNYFSVASDLIEEAAKVNEESLHNLRHIR